MHLRSKTLILNYFKSFGSIPFSSLDLKKATESEQHGIRVAEISAMECRFDADLNYPTTILVFANYSFWTSHKISFISMRSEIFALITNQPKQMVFNYFSFDNDFPIIRTTKSKRNLMTGHIFIHGGLIQLVIERTVLVK